MSGITEDVILHAKESRKCIIIFFNWALVFVRIVVENSPDTFILLRTDRVW